MAGADSDPSHSATPLVSVIGTAVVRAEPDEATLVVTLSALKDGPGAALEDVARRSEMLVALLDRCGIDSSDRSTTGVSVHEEFDHTQAGRRSLGHRAASAIAVRLTDLELIGRLVTRATTEFDARVDGPRWQVAAENPVRLEAARQAAANGQRKAQAYAAGVGASLGALIRLVEPESAMFPRPAGKFIAASGSSGDLPVETGEQDVIATVEVTFALIP
jgi:uncharacterized protein YggE